MKISGNPSFQITDFFALNKSDNGIDAVAFSTADSGAEYKLIFRGDLKTKEQTVVSWDSIYLAYEEATRYTVYARLLAEGYYKEVFWDDLNPEYVKGGDTIASLIKEEIDKFIKENNLPPCQRCELSDRVSTSLEWDNINSPVTKTIQKDEFILRSIHKRPKVEFSLKKLLIEKCKGDWIMLKKLLSKNKKVILRGKYVDFVQTDYLNIIKFRQEEYSDNGVELPAFRKYLWDKIGNIKTVSTLNYEDKIYKVTNLNALRDRLDQTKALFVDLLDDKIKSTKILTNSSYSFHDNGSSFKVYHNSYGNFHELGLSIVNHPMITSFEGDIWQYLGQKFNDTEPENWLKYEEVAAESFEINGYKPLLINFPENGSTLFLKDTSGVAKTFEIKNYNRLTSNRSSFLRSILREYNNSSIASLELYPVELECATNYDTEQGLVFMYGADKQVRLWDANRDSLDSFVDIGKIDKIENDLLFSALFQAIGERYLNGLTQKNRRTDFTFVGNPQPVVSNQDNFEAVRIQFQGDDFHTLLGAEKNTEAIYSLEVTGLENRNLTDSKQVNLVEALFKSFRSESENCQRKRVNVSYAAGRQFVYDEPSQTLYYWDKQVGFPEVGKVYKPESDDLWHSFFLKDIASRLDNLGEEETLLDSTYPLAGDILEQPNKDADPNQEYLAVKFSQDIFYTLYYQHAKEFSRQHILNLEKYLDEKAWFSVLLLKTKLQADTIVTVLDDRDDYYYAYHHPNLMTWSNNPKYGWSSSMQKQVHNMGALDWPVITINTDTSAHYYQSSIWKEFISTVDTSQKKSKYRDYFSDAITFYHPGSSHWAIATRFVSTEDSKNYDTWISRNSWQTDSQALESEPVDDENQSEAIVDLKNEGETPTVKHFIAPIKTFKTYRPFLYHYFQDLYRLATDEQPSVLRIDSARSNNSRYLSIYNLSANSNTEKNFSIYRVDSRFKERELGKRFYNKLVSPSLIGSKVKFAFYDRYFGYIITPIALDKKGFVGYTKTWCHYFFLDVKVKGDMWKNKKEIMNSYKKNGLAERFDSRLKHGRNTQIDSIFAYACKYYYQGKYNKKYWHQAYLDKFSEDYREVLRNFHAEPIEVLLGW